VVRANAASAVGVTAFVVTAVFYALGSGRAYDYDSSETVGSFIATRSLLDPFRRQLQFKNHPFFSFVDHLVYSAGGHSPSALRAAPIVFGALTVGIVAYWASRRWGLTAGVAAAAVLAANPMFAELSRSVRGYSLLALCAVVSTLLLGRLLDEPRRGLTIIYELVVAVAVATHLYALLLVVGHVAIVVARRKFDAEWAAVWFSALLFGLSAYAAIASRMLGSASNEHGLFQPGFPAAAARALLGSSALAVALLAALLLYAAVRKVPRELLLGSATVALALAAVWLSSPQDLYPRFLVWLVPGIALLVASATRRSRAALLLACVAVAATVHLDSRYWTTDPVPSLRAAQTVDAARSDNDRPCVLPNIRGALMGYTRSPAEISNPAQFRSCGIVLGTAFDAHSVRVAARAAFPYHWRLPAETPYIIYSREPQKPSANKRLTANQRTRLPATGAGS
jgi:predicted membrane-bound mannosyltransferase